MQRPLEISLYQIQVFIRAAECGSFTAVATQFNTTQSSISKVIAAMETALGVPLFIRGKKRMELSEEGKFLYNHWRGLIANVEASVDQVVRMRQAGLQTLTVGVPDSLENGDEEVYLQRFRELYPEVRVTYHVVPANRLVSSLEAEEVDLVITGLYEHKSLDRLGICWKNYVNVPNVAIIHQSNPLADRETLTLENLKEEEFIMLAPSDNASYFERIYLLCAQCGFQPRISGFVPSFRSMMATLIRSRQGVVISNRFISNANHPELRYFELHGTNAGMIVAWKKKASNPYTAKLAELFPDCGGRTSF